MLNCSCNPRHPQNQGLVEQGGNSIVERKLRTPLSERGTNHWSELLIEICFAMNSEVHSSLRLTPYEITFRRTENWIPIEEREQALLHAAQDEKISDAI